MVKNTHGGSGHKKFARKHTSGSKSNKLRVSEDEGELYSIVTNLLGNGMFHCLCIDGTIRLGHIRGKFTGRGKRDNLVELGKWILVGLREWDIHSEKSSSISKGKEKMQQCDLLEVYSDSDKQRLRETISENWSILDCNDKTKVSIGDATLDDNITFGTERDFEREKLIEEMKSNTDRITLKAAETNSSETEEEVVNFEDI